MSSFLTEAEVMSNTIKHGHRIHNEVDPRILHANTIKTRQPQLNSLITLYSKSNFIHYVFRVFHVIPTPNIVSWTSLISAFSGSPLSFHHFISMLRYSPFLPNCRVFGSLLKTCASLSTLPFALQLQSLAHKTGLNCDPFVGSALVSVYCKSRLVGCAHKVFDEMRGRDEVCYGAMINGLAQNGEAIEALGCFVGMRRCGVGTNMYSVSGILRAIAEVAMLEQCRIIHGHAVVTGWDLDMIVGTALIDAYGKCGLVSAARGVFDTFEWYLNVVGWNAMLSAYAQQGDKDSAVDLFRIMEGIGLKPDEYTFLAVLTAFHNAGRAEECKRWLTKMRVDYQVEPGLEHYTSLIGALGRAGKLEEAERVALAMPLEPDAAVWRVLLSSAASHGKAKIAWRMRHKLLDIDPNDDSAYVLSANASATAGEWDGVIETWKMMKDRQVRKEGGRSWIELRGEVHEFLARDTRHERKEEIYAKLAELMDEIEKLGYVPAWDEMLHNVDQNVKKEALRNHSEKLALAFLVLNGAAHPGKALRIVKNLRICKDCHQAFKYFSILLQSEIIVRDVNRYHKFFNGNCSCRDYW